MRLLQMYLTSPQDNTTITAPYNVTVASTGPLTEAQPWVWSATVTPNGEVRCSCRALWKPDLSCAVCAAALQSDS